MKVKIYVLVVLLGVLALATGCQSTASVSYRPSYSTSYDTVSKIPIAVKAVLDNRSLEPTIYYKNSRNGDTGQFDKPVADLVSEAVATELRKAGHPISITESGSIILNCEILRLEATMDEAPFQSPVLDMEVLLRFQWTDAKTGRILANNERSEHRSRKLGFSHPVKLPFDNAIVQGYGDEIVNDMLPRVIEKEIELSPFLDDRTKLQRIATSEASEPAESILQLNRATVAAVEVEKWKDNDYGLRIKFTGYGINQVESMPHQRWIINGKEIDRTAAVKLSADDRRDGVIWHPGVLQKLPPPLTNPLSFDQAQALSKEIMESPNH